MAGNGSGVMAINMSIDSYKFGRVVIDGKRYASDLIILPGRIVENWRREEGHLLKPADLEEVVKEKPEVLIVGRGARGVMRISEEVRRYLEEEGIELIEAISSEAVRIFNEMVAKRKVACALHLTC